MAMADLCAHFGIAASTGGNKAKLVRTALGMGQFNHNWMLPSRVAGSAMVWMIQVNGFILDARQLPVEVQKEAVRKGLIPFVHQPSGHRSSSARQIPGWRDDKETRMAAG